MTHFTKRSTAEQVTEGIDLTGKDVDLGNDGRNWIGASTVAEEPPEQKNDDRNDCDDDQEL